MEKWRDYIGFCLIALTGVLLLCTVFEHDRSLVNGLVMGKVFWFQRIIPVFCLAVLIASLLKNAGKCFSFSVADFVLFAFVGLSHLFYNRELNPEPDKLFFEGQLLLLWFSLRIGLSVFPRLKTFFILLLLSIAAVEAITGLQQLYGLQASNHSLFRLTGSFYNPGPYSGFLAMLVPVALSFMLKTGRVADRKGWIIYKLFHYFSWLVLVLIVIVLPAGMSRTAWIAAFAASAFVYWIQGVGMYQSKTWIKSHRTLTFTLSIAGFLLLSVLSIGVFMLKKDSANGRLLLWKVTTVAIAQQPFTGTGIGGFPAAYAKQQATYFASDKASEEEALVAGTPEYAFNEFFQIALERGIPVLLLFLFFIGCTLYKGIKNRQYGAAGGILALCVFSLASYPLQLPEFSIVFIFLAAIAVTAHEKRRLVNPISFIIPIFILSATIYHLQQENKTHYQEWNIAQQRYNNKAYKAALSQYESLYPYLKHKPEFLFEMGQCQSKTNKYDEAVRSLTRASRLSADPMIHYMIAKNEQLRGNYEEAERILIHAINILPERIYPYYLLVLLYNEPNFYQPEKLQCAATAVLTKEPKVFSIAIQEMRKETEKILTDI